jgi:hypothetical protein
VYQTYLTQCIDMARGSNDRESQHDGTPQTLDAAHDEFAAATGVDLPAALLEAFDLARYLRNRIVHYGGVQGSHLSAKWRSLSRGAREAWIEVAGRPLPAGKSREELDLGLNELIAVLALTKRLAVSVNVSLQPAIGREAWARIAVEDYQTLQPERFAQRDVRLRRAFGFAMHYYLAIALTRDELAGALHAVL